MELNEESDIDLNNEVDEIEELRDEVLSVYEQIRNLVVNLKRSRPSSVTVSHKGLSISGSSLHTSLGSSESSQHSGVQFQVKTSVCQAQYYHLVSVLYDQWPFFSTI